MKPIIRRQGTITPPRIEIANWGRYTVLRFWNTEVMNDIDSVIRAIIQAMDAEHHFQF
jgi:very-short-patch-repair endonuclease